MFKKALGIATRNSVSKRENNTFLFIHIPKTAGTSLRKALEKKYNVISDYGVGDKQTHRLVREHIYNNNDFYGLRRALKGCSFCLSGHYSVNKYSDVVDIAQTITFVRKPLQQVISHFNHFKTHFNEQKSIEDFILQPRFKNSQFKYIQPIPLGLLGYVGITEDYNNSVQMINQHLGLEIATLVENVNHEKAASVERISDELKSTILTLNSQDVALYEEANWLHECRKKFAENNKVWTHAYAKVIPQNILVGAAYRTKDDAPIKLHVKVADKLIKEVLANEFMPEFPKANLPRNRYIRFHLPLNKLVKSSAKVDVYIADTHQKVNHQPLTLHEVC